MRWPGRGRSFFDSARWRRRRRKGIMKEMRRHVPLAAARAGAPGTSDTIGRLMHSENERTNGAMQAMRLLPPPAAAGRPRAVWGSALLAVAVLLAAARGAAANGDPVEDLRQALGEPAPADKAGYDARKKNLQKKADRPE